jgi:dTDP-4-dehydrorhamnose reductase
MNMSCKIRILIVGENGQVGRALVRAAALFPIFELCTFSRVQADFLDPKCVMRAVQGIPNIGVVVNVAAYTDVDRAESQRDVAFRVNGESAGALAHACASRDIPLIHLSTDYVFDGQKTEAYLESDKPNPINVYGASKLDGEMRIRSVADRYVIVRTSWVYGIYGKNFVKTIIRLGRERDELTVIDDQHGAPTSAHDIANTVLAIAYRVITNGSEECFGLFHYTGGGATNWFCFAQEIAAQTANWAPMKAKIVPVSSETYRTAARRPPNSRLDCEKIGLIYGVEKTPWPISLKIVLDEMRKEQMGK